MLLINFADCYLLRIYLIPSIVMYVDVKYMLYTFVQSKTMTVLHNFAIGDTVGAVSVFFTSCWLCSEMYVILVVVWYGG